MLPYFADGFNWPVILFCRFPQSTVIHPARHFKRDRTEHGRNDRSREPCCAGRVTRQAIAHVLLELIILRAHRRRRWQHKGSSNTADRAAWAQRGCSQQRSPAPACPPWASINTSCRARCVGRGVEQGKGDTPQQGTHSDLPSVGCERQQVAGWEQQGPPSKLAQVLPLVWLFPAVSGGL